MGERETVGSAPPLDQLGLVGEPRARQRLVGRPQHVLFPFQNMANLLRAAYQALARTRLPDEAELFERRSGPNGLPLTVGAIGGGRPTWPEIVFKDVST